MTVREALRAQRKAMKDRSLKENIAYLWDYYGMKAILLIIVVIALLSTVISVVSRKDSGFCGAFFGVVPRQEAEPYLQDFAEAAGIDTGRYSLSVQVSPDIRLRSTVTEDAFQHMQRFSAMVASKTADTFAANQDLFLYYSYAVSTPVKKSCKNPRFAHRKPGVPLFYLPIRSSTASSLPAVKPLRKTSTPVLSLQIRISKCLDLIT